MEKIKLTPKEFIELLNETTLNSEQKNMVIDLIPQLSTRQVNQVIDLLFADKKALEKIITKMESEQQQAILDFEIQIEQIKNQQQ